MQGALELAENGVGNVSPNPLVGCVIVHNGKVIGEGWHQEAGKNHAEINAINSVKDKVLLSSAQLYVTLEPCAHHGKTPPCVDAIIKNNISQVIICNNDPNTEVSGNGIDTLIKAGVDVKTGVMQEKGNKLNKSFFTFHRKKRPYVILKWAQTKDGFIAKTNYDSKWISNISSRKLGHKWRSTEDSILVGFNTAKYDNPRLNIRNWIGANPVRIVIDEKLNLSQELFVFDGEVPTICFNTVKGAKLTHIEFVKIDFSNLEISICNELFNRGIQSILIEGGSKTLADFIRHNLWDEAKVFTSSQKFKEGILAPVLNSNIQSKHTIEGDKLCIYTNEKSTRD